VDDPRKKLKRDITLSIVVLLAVMSIIGTVFCTGVFAQTSSEESAMEASLAISTNVEGLKFGLIAAAVAFGFGAIGAGIAISHVGAAAMGAVAEKPQIAGQALIFVALAEGIVVFGFITALMILGKIQ
jgi:V/A-type H+-transporting ATPase subunit K